LFTAIQLFYEYGYNTITMMDIAMATNVGISLVNYHFPSRRALREGIFEYYEGMQKEALPDLEELLRMAETVPPQALIERIMTWRDTGAKKMREAILSIAIRDVSIDARCAQFIQEMLFLPIERLLIPVLDKLIELGRIEPFDKEAFVFLLERYCFSGSALHGAEHRTHRIDMGEKGLSLLFSLIKPAGKPGEGGSESGIGSGAGAGIGDGSGSGIGFDCLEQSAPA